jgi:hypothetical protein
VQKYPPLFKDFVICPFMKRAKLDGNYQKVIFWLAVSKEYANCPPEAHRPFFDFDSDQTRLLYYKIFAQSTPPGIFHQKKKKKIFAIG